MGLDFELSELASLRPIRTAVSSSRLIAWPGGNNGSVTPTPCGATRTARRDGGAESAADTGVVTPTAGNFISVASRQDAVDTCCVTPAATASSGAAAQQDGDPAGGSSCVTPTSASCALRPATVCPPAPRKQRPTKRKQCGGAPPPRLFFFPVPHDLAAVFVARAAAPTPFLSAKKIRLDVVG